MALRAFHFSYAGENKPENIRFYRRMLRGFLRWHRGDCVWIKGGRVKREAYIVIKEHLIGNLIKMLEDELEQGGKFTYKEVNPHYIINEAKELNRETLGYLKHGEIEIGDPDTIPCPKEDYREVSVNDWCWGKKREARCDAWTGKKCIYPKMVSQKVNYP